MLKVKDLKVDYATQKSISYSQYSAYSQCPYQWYLNYVEKRLDFKPSIHLVFGTSMHEVFQTYLDTMYTKSVAEANKVNYCDLLKAKLVEHYQKAVENQKDAHFSTPVELMEFYKDGCEIINWFLKKRSLFFSKKKVKLIGIEVPLVSPISDKVEKVVYRGHVDFILYDEVLDRYTIYDIKTSTRGWGEEDKKDKVKISQVLLYKKIFCDIYSIPEDKVEVCYLILKRKIYENSEFPIPRIQTFKPADGKVSINKAVKGFQEFIENVYNTDGTYKDTKHLKIPSKLCNWCAYNNTELCDKKN